MYKFVVYFGVFFEDVYISGFGRDYLFICIFYLKFFKDFKCDDLGILDVIKSFIKEDGKLNKNFVNTMEFEFEVLVGLYKGFGFCKFLFLVFNILLKLYNYIDRLDVF